jgi:hypothetical protein
MSKFIFLFSFLLLLGCAASDTATQNIQPITSETFLRQPFSFSLNMEYFEKEKGDEYRRRRFIRTLSTDTNRRDTLYKFLRKGNSFIFYKTQYGKKSFLTSVIRYKKTLFNGNFHIGMSRPAINQVFTDKEFLDDTCKIESADRQAVFIFNDKDKLQEVQLNDFFQK